MKNRCNKFEQGLGKVRGYAGMGKWRAEASRVQALGNMTLRIYAQAFLFYADTNIREATYFGGLGELAQALLQLIRQSKIPE